MIGSRRTPVWRLVARFSMIATIALIAIGILAISDLRRQHVSEASEQARVQAEILAASVAAPLDFDDKPAAAEAMATIRVNPAILAAATYDRNGKLFAQFNRPGQMLPDRLPRLLDHLHHSVPVMRERTRIGTVYLMIDDEAPARKFVRYGVIALFVVLALIVVGILAFAQTLMRRANQDLRTANVALRRQIVERQRVEIQLRQAQKMESLGQLTGGIAHDFNNMLAIVIGSLDMARRKMQTAPDLALRAIGNAVEGAERAADLTRRLLAFSRRQPLDPARIEVNGLVADICEMLGRTLGSAIRIETMLADGLPTVHADRGLLESAIVNLGLNARDAMPAGGTLTISTALRDGMVDIEIRDTGCGMPPEVAERAIEPFFTTKGIGQGTGLGLSQVYGFVKQSGGDLHIESAPDRGTRVRMSLPASPADNPVSVDDTDASSAARTHQGECVLVVEDEQQVRGMVVDSLRELGYAALEAGDGPEGLALLDAHPEVKLLFTDIRMPGMSGWELARRARRRRPSLPIVFTSGFAPSESDEADDPRRPPILPKPFTIGQLADTVRRSLDRQV